MDSYKYDQFRGHQKKLCDIPNLVRILQLEDLFLVQNPSDNFYLACRKKNSNISLKVQQLIIFLISIEPENIDCKMGQIVLFKIFIIHLCWLKES